MRILVAGEFRYPMYEAAACEALRGLGADIVCFSWMPYFAKGYGRIEAYAVLEGPAVRRMNRELIAACREARPDVVLIWRGTCIVPRTLAAIKEACGARLVSYNNDNPFAPAYERSLHIPLRRLWSLFRQAIPEYDQHFVFRRANVNEFLGSGAKRVTVLLPWYMPAMHYPDPDAQELKQRPYDVSLVGYYEEVRLEYVRALVAAGYRVRVFGPTRAWKAHLGKLWEEVGPVYPVYGAEYRRALLCGRLSLCAFSRLNVDECTTRVFEIPACGQVLLCERNEQMLQLFAEDEAVYYSSAIELVTQVDRYAKDCNALGRVGSAGYDRCVRGGHSIGERMATLVSELVNGDSSWDRPAADTCRAV